MPIVIDGWNLIRDSSSDIPDEEGSYLEPAETLIAYLEDFQRSHSDPIVLVFDSKREFMDIRRPACAGLKIVPAKDADVYIKRLVDSTPERQRHNLRVVSSDNSVYYHARSSGATAMISKEFWKKLYAGSKAGNTNNKEEDDG